MGNTYYITGSQIGMLQGFISLLRKDEVEEVLQEIFKNQEITKKCRTHTN